MAQIWALRNEKDNPWDIFSTVEIDSRINKDVLVNEIIRRCGSLTPVYNVTDTFVYFTNHFFKREYDNIKSMLDLSEKEYEPLENFQRIENTTKSSNTKSTLDESDSGSSSDEGSDEEKTSAYNEDVYQPYNKTNSSNNSNYYNKRDYTRGNDFKGEEDVTAHGINGLVTRQDLVLKEREIIKFNIVTWIVDKYCVELFYQVF